MRSGRIIHLVPERSSKSPLLLRLMLFLVAGGIILLPLGERGPAMKLNAFASVAMPAKPLIDTQQPKEVATATFAMG